MSSANAIVFEPAASLPRHVDLAADHLDLWFASLAPPPAQVDAFRALLSPDEVARADRFRFPEHRRRHVVAHGILRTLLAAYLGLPADAVTFTTGPHGKPSVPGVDLHFNLAHTGDYALYGFSRSELGVDIEEARPGRDLLQLAMRFFAPLERETLQALPEEDRRGAFYRGWTRKEAYIKALGRGVSEPLDGFAVTMRDGEPARLLHTGAQGGEPADWTLLHLQPLEDVMGAVALRGRPAAVHAWRLRPDVAPASAAR